jgi:hypothetical protein
MFTRENIVEGAKKEPGFIREQHCLTCKNVLAIEIADKLGFRKGSEHYVVKNCLWLAKEPHLYYIRERWYGNPIVCPVCGRSGKLPIDKPYAQELIEKSQGERNAFQNRNN